MLPLHLPPIGLGEIVTFVNEDYISKLESLFCTVFNKEKAVFTADARNAIHLALKVMGLQNESRGFRLWIIEKSYLYSGKR